MAWQWQSPLAGNSSSAVAHWAQTRKTPNKTIQRIRGIVSLLHLSGCLCRRTDLEPVRESAASTGFRIGSGWELSAAVPPPSATLTHWRLARRAIALVTRGLIRAGRIGWPNVCSGEESLDVPSADGRQFARFWALRSGGRSYGSHSACFGASVVRFHRWQAGMPLGLDRRAARDRSFTESARAEGVNLFANRRQGTNRRFAAQASLADNAEGRTAACALMPCSRPLAVASSVS